MRVDQLIAEVAFDRGMTTQDIIGKGPGSRRKSRVSARAEVAWQLRFGGYSYPEIGTILGGRDHTTAMYLVKEYQQK